MGHDSGIQKTVKEKGANSTLPQPGVGGGKARRVPDLPGADLAEAQMRFPSQHQFGAGRLQALPVGDGAAAPATSAPRPADGTPRLSSSRT
jgi:hypothetical protein